MSDMGRWLLILGAIIFITGLVFVVGGRLFPWLGHLPGDIHYEGKNTRVFIPITTMILISIVGTIVLNVLIRLFRR